MMLSMDEAKAFLEQNDGFAEGLTEDDLATVEEYAEHHAGGLFVLGRYAEDGGVYVKAHDSWGGPDDEGRDIIVHVYDPEGEGVLVEDGGTDIVTYYATGHEALEAFLAAGATTEEQA